MNTNEHIAALLRSAATNKGKVGSFGSGELFFACAFLLAASVPGEGGEKRTTAKNKRPDVSSLKKAHNIPGIQNLQTQQQKIKHKRQRLERLYHEENSQS